MTKFINNKYHQFCLIHNSSDLNKQYYRHKTYCTIELKYLSHFKTINNIEKKD